MRSLKYALLLGASLLATFPATAATTTANMNVRITITDECKIQTVNDLDFGPHGVIDANVDQTTNISVQCTTGKTYNVGLSAGGGAGATVAVRKMTGPAAATINYTIYRENTFTQVWGITIPTDTVGGTGNGSVQTIPIYGRVPPQTTPGAGLYTDIVQITVTY